MIKLKKISSKKLISLLISISIILIYRFFSPTSPNHQTTIDNNSSKQTVFVATNSAMVKRVIDGDTIQLDNNQLVRYIGIDTPELHDPRKKIECFAQQAYEFNKNLVEGKIVYLEKDVSEIDKYNRLLRYVWVENAKIKDKNPKIINQNGQIMVNEILVRDGYAYATTFPPDVKYADTFLQAQQEAMKNNRGLWQNCNPSLKPQ